MTGGEAAVKSLKKEKVEHVFGLIGSATMEMFDALYYEKKIKFIANQSFERFPKIVGKRGGKGRCFEKLVYCFCF